MIEFGHFFLLFGFAREKSFVTVAFDHTVAFMAVWSLEFQLIYNMIAASQHVVLR